MKEGRKRMVLLCCAVLTVSTAGCTGASPAKNPYRVDTVVRIPVEPTQLPAATETTPPTVPAIQETVIQTEPVPTESAGKETAGSAAKSSGGAKTSGSSSNATRPPQATEAPETQPPATEATEPEGQLYDISGYTVGNLEYAVLEQINADRAEAGLAALSMDTRLCAIASARAYEISVSWSHTRPDGRGYSTVLSDYGYGAGCVSENLAYSSAPSAQDVVDKWMESKSTQGNLLGSGFTAAGIGVYNSGGICYLACLFVG